MLMFSFSGVSAQQSVDLNGTVQSNVNERFRLNSFELNPVNFSQTRDWEISMNYGTAISGTTYSGNFSVISLSKRLKSSYLYARITPGYQMDFTFNTGARIVYTDTSEVLKSNLEYRERFGIGFSHRFSNLFTVGFTFRYFTQNFTQEILNPVFNDTLNAIYTETTEYKTNYWRGDFGLLYSPFPELNISVASFNLLTLNETEQPASDFDYAMNTKKGAIFGIDYLPMENFSALARIETDASFFTGINYGFELFGGQFSAAAAVFHDKNQEPYIAGIVPSLNLSYSFLSFTLSAVNYFSERNKSFTDEEFFNYGVSNLVNNRFSQNRIQFSVNAALSFTPEEKLKLIDVKIEKEIFPTLDGIYAKEPFAKAVVVSVSDQKEEATVSGFIPGLNENEIHSPSVTIAPGDTVEIPVYTLIEKSYGKGKRKIVEAEFKVYARNGNLNGKLNKPVLINSENGWDGRIETLKYFMSKDFDFAIEYSKSVLSAHKNELGKIDKRLENFVKAKILFDDFAGKISYVSDPRTSAEYVQFPNQTLKLKGGDCDDLSVAVSALLESVGIETAFVDYKSKDGISHVNIIFNTKLSPEESSLITINDKKYIIRKSVRDKAELWIPLEVTSLKNFETSWSLGAEKFRKEAVENFGLSNGEVRIVDIY